MDSPAPPPPNKINSIISNFRENGYPRQVWYLIICCISVLALLRAIAWLWYYWTLQRARRIPQGTASVSDTELQAKPPNGGVHTGILTKLSLAVLSQTRIIAFRLSVPVGFGSRVTFAELIASAAYLAALLTWEFINTRDVLTGENLSINYWANRAGALASSQLTFIVALAGKNNIVSLLTGISYEKLHILHRAASRSILVLIWIHFLARRHLGLTGDDVISNGWVRAGIAAASALTILVIIGNRFVRSKFYEAFILIHNFFVMLILICLFFHTRSGNYEKFVWPAMLLWGFERLLRLARVIYAKILQHRTSVPTKAVVEVLSSDTLRVTITLRRSRLLHWRPGQNVYLCIPVASPFWHPSEFHPFTIANIATQVSVAQRSDAEKAMDDENMQMKFIIRARDGFTARLHHYAWDSAVNAGRGRDPQFVSAFVDGPYGSPPNIAAYQTLVCIAGGSGVSFTLPLLMDVVRRASSNPMGLLCRRVLFVWSVRDMENLDWIASDLKNTLSSVPPFLEVEICVFVTGSRRGIAVGSPLQARRGLDADTKNLLVMEEGSTEKVVETEVQASDSEHAAKSFGSDADALLRDQAVSVSSGRPQVQDILLEESKRCEGESMLVCVSGPSSLATSVRNALCHSSIAGLGAAFRGTNVSLHVEGFALA